jgi:hypothetical protein
MFLGCCLMIWSIIMGKVFMLFLFYGEQGLVNFVDKLQGIFVVLFGLFFVGVFTLNLIRSFELYYVEIGYLN